MSEDYPCDTCEHFGQDMLQEPCCRCVEYQDYARRHVVDSPYTGSDDPDTNEALERFLRLLNDSFDRLNDHLAQIAGELHHLNESTPITEWRRSK